MHDLLAAIVSCSRASVAARRRTTPLRAMAERPTAREPRGALFRDRLTRPGAINVIAECKRRSPARGVLRRRYDPAAIARGYAAGDAAAVSVLTEPCFFDGDLAHLSAVRAAVGVPVLCKDFIVDAYQIYEARAAGADAVLLIAAALADDELAALMRLADDLGIAALTEVHTGRDLDAALDAGASIIGVNSRDLRTLDVKVGTFDDLRPRIPASCATVAESGLRRIDDVRRVARAGYDAVLIGEWLMTHEDPAALLRELRAGTTA